MSELAAFPASVPRALEAFGMRHDVAIDELLGGAINRCYSVRQRDRRWVLKEFNGHMTQEKLSLICEAQALMSTKGQPVPELSLTREGDHFTCVDGAYFTLSRFVEGRTHRADGIPIGAAESMGAALAKLHDALVDLPPASPTILLDPAVFRTKVDELLPLVARDPRRRQHSALLERKLLALEELPTVDQPLPCQWLHGDFTPRNVIFDNGDVVAGIIDFDNVQFMPRAYDVMRCFAFGFPAGSAEAEHFFVAYARAAQLTADDVRAYVEHWWWQLTFRLWPLDAHYTDPYYQPSWDEAIDSLWPPPPDHWHQLVDRLSALVQQ